MKLVITSTDKKLESLSNDLPDGVSARAIPREDSTHAIPPELETVYTIVIDWVEPVAQGVLVAWLYDKLKSLKGKATVNGKAIQSDNVLNDEIAKNSNNDKNDGE